jgi:molecular chaperone HtpG
LDSDVSKFIKRPNQQEATVAGMFFEQLGRDAFEEFRPYISGYKGRYDLYGRIGKKSFSIEFKFDLAGLFKDFADERKMFDEIDVVVIWDLTERDWKLVAARGLSLAEVKQSPLGGAPSRFPQSHYELRLSGVNPIEIVCMHRILKPS